jgi:hypothetical protein
LLDIGRQPGGHAIRDIINTPDILKGRDAGARAGTDRATESHWCPWDAVMA